MNENFNTITVMDYALNEIRVYRNVETDNADKWLDENDEHWNESTCYYMYGEDTEIKEDDRGGIKMSRRKMFNTITVMDYVLNEIRVYRNVKTENPEKWLQEHDEHWHESTCYYMYGEDTEVKDYDKQK